MAGLVDVDDDPAAMLTGLDKGDGFSMRLLASDEDPRGGTLRDLFWSWPAVLSPRLEDVEAGLPVGTPDAFEFRLADYSRGTQSVQWQDEWQSIVA